MRARRILKIVAGVLVAGAAAFFAIGLHNARADPVVRQAYVAMPDWPKGAKPVRVALISDIHIGSWAMDAGRLTRIIGEVDALKPDLVVIAGDLINGNDPHHGRRQMQDLVAPLSRLHPPLGSFATIGNHDMWTGPGPIAAPLRQAGVTLLHNSAVSRGPLAIGGMDYTPYGATDLDTTMAKLRKLPGARLLITHTPEISNKVPGDVSLMLAGHTHCGQAVFPVIGVAYIILQYGDRYLCGLKHVDGRTVVITAGLGTSVVPLRFGAPPDLWLLTLGPQR